MLDSGYIKGADGKTYEWCARHYNKRHYLAINYGRVDWIAMADENGLVTTVDHFSGFPKPGVVRDIVNALIERFEWEGEQYEKGVR